MDGWESVIFPFQSLEDADADAGLLLGGPLPITLYCATGVCLAFFFSY